DNVHLLVVLLMWLPHPLRFQYIHLETFKNLLIFFGHFKQITGSPFLPLLTLPGLSQGWMNLETHWWRFWEANGIGYCSLQVQRRSLDHTHDRVCTFVHIYSLQNSSATS